MVKYCATCPNPVYEPELHSECEGCRGVPAMHRHMLEGVVGEPWAYFAHRAEATKAFWSFMARFSDYRFTIDHHPDQPLYPYAIRASAYRPLIGVTP